MSPGRTVLVTGGCGYVGSVLLRRLALETDVATVRILDNLQRDSHRALFDLPAAGPRFEFLQGDLLDPAMVERALEGADVVFHLAGIVRTPMTFENPAWMRQVNQWGTHRLAEAAAERGVARFVFASSTSVYGPGENHGEDAPLRPVGPYAESKAGAERAVGAACAGRSGHTVVRLGMVYGDAPAVRLDGFVNRMIFQAATSGSLTIHGSGEQRRPVIHVDDAAEALVFAGRDEAFAGGVVNAVSANPRIHEVARSLQRQRPDVTLRATDQDAPTHLSFAADAAALRRQGWAPRVDHDEAVAAFLDRLAALRFPR